MKFNIFGASKETGKDVEFVIDAANYTDAQEKAKDIGIYVSQIEASSESDSASRGDNISDPAPRTLDKPKQLCRKTTTPFIVPCVKCGVDISPSLKNCSKCGAKQPTEALGILFSDAGNVWAMIVVIVLLALSITCCTSYCSYIEQWEFEPTGAQSQDLHSQHQAAIAKFLEANQKGDIEAQRYWSAEMDRLAEEIRRREGAN